VVVFASFMCNMIVDGIAYTFGVFLGEFVKFFGEGKGKTAWVGSLLSGMYLSAGQCSFPSSFIFSREFYDCRSFTIHKHSNIHHFRVLRSNGFPPSEHCKLIPSSIYLSVLPLSYTVTDMTITYIN